MRPMTESCWPSLKRSKLGGITQKVASMKFLGLQTITNSNISWIQKALALGKSDGLKNCQGTTFGLIIDKEKLTKLLMPCHDTPSGVLRKKRPSKPWIQKCCTDCNLCWHGSRGWTFRVWVSPPPCTKSSSVGQPSYRSCISFGIPFGAS